MKIGIFIKQVPDTETKVVIKADKSGVVSDGIKFIIGPYDEFAIEEALKIKDKTSCETVVATVGPERSTESLRTALAMGVDRAVHVVVPEEPFAKLDNFLVGQVLVGIAKKESFDIIFMGIKAVDTDMSQMVQIVAEGLNEPHCHNISKIELGSDGKSADIEFEADGGKGIASIQFPCVIGTGKTPNTPRYATLPGIMKAKKKEIKVMTTTDLGLDPHWLSSVNNKTVISQYDLPPQKSKGKMLDGDPEAQVKELVRLLHEEVKIL